MDIARAVQLVDRALTPDGQPWAVVGGLGLQALGLSRATFDLDIVAPETARSIITRALVAAGYAELNASPGFGKFVHPDAAMGRIDFVFVDETTAGKMFSACTPFDLVGARVLVPRPEHLIAMKVQAMKNDPARTFQDLADIQFLLSLPRVDPGEVEGYFRRAGLEARFEELKKLVGR